MKYVYVRINTTYKINKEEVDKPKMIKAIFIDIDGTLRDSKEQINKRTIESIKKVASKGILVVICSGRPRKYTEDISKQCNASKYIICSNGGAIYDYKEKRVIYENVMNKNACIDLYKIAVEAGVRFIMNVGENRVVNHIKHHDGSEIEMKTNIETFIKENNVVQCVIVDEDLEKIRKLKPAIEKIKKVKINNQHKALIDSNTKQGGSIYYDIANMDCNKGNAIKKFCKTMSIDLSDTIAIGDGHNDISMFQMVGYSVAMENAAEDVKAYANEVTATNEENGVAQFLEKLI